MHRTRAHAIDEDAPRRTQLALMALFGALVAAMAATAAAIGAGLGG